MAERKKKKGRGRIWIFVLAAVIFIFVAIYFSQIKKSVQLLGKINPWWLAIAVLSQVATYFSSSLIFQSLFHSFQIKKKIGLVKLAELSVVTLFFNLTVPSAQISGNTFLFGYLKKKQIEPAQIL